MQFKCKCGGLKRCNDPEPGAVTFFFCMCGAETRIERTDGGTFVVVPVNRGLPNPRIPSFGEYLDKTTSEIIEDLTDLFFNGTVSDEPIRCWGISMEQPTESELKRALKAAVKREDYELAAQLRDQINQL